MVKTYFLLAATALLLPAGLARAESGAVKVQAVTVTEHLEAYARVEPVAVLKLNATHAGTVTGLTALPGDTVKTGQILARLTGPVAEDLLARSRNAVAAAEAARSAASGSLDVERRKLEEQLATRKDVYQAEAALAEAQALLDSARSRLRAARAGVTLKAPVDATVVSIDAAEGEPVQQGQTVVALRQTGALWLRAGYYGPDAAAVRVGMKGRFLPAGGAPSIKVKVRAIIGVVRPDGGLEVGLSATEPAPGWRDGETGTVILEGAARTMAAVPTRALILDRGRWWVLIRTGRGNQPKEVVPGPSRGDSTLIEQGLKPGAEVVVDNAYLEFHREFSRQYQPPD